jgi:hypothetical protein
LGFPSRTVRGPRLVEQGGIPSPGAPEAFRALIVADSKKFAEIIRDVGIPMEG